MKTKPYKRYIILSIVALALLSGSGWGLWRLGIKLLEKSSWSSLEAVQVVGLDRLSEKEIVTATGLKRGANIMRLPLDKIAARVEKVAGVRQARVIRKLPGKLIIRVEEREPVACLYQDKFWFIDGDGTPFPLVASNEEIDVPVLTGKLDAGTKNPVVLKRVASIAAMIQEDYPHVFDHLSEISLHDGRVEMRLKEGGAKVLAHDPGSPAALSKLEQFLQQKGNEIPSGCAYIDLRYPAMVVTGTIG